MFRTWNANVWKPGPEVLIDKAGSATYGAVAGPSYAASGKPSGRGYLLLWRRILQGGLAQPFFAVTQENGKLVKGPVSVDKTSTYPGVGMRGVEAQGNYFVIAQTCAPSASCLGKGLRVMRVVAGSGSKANLQLVETIPVSPKRAARVPTVVSYGDGIWVVWRELLVGLSSQGKQQHIRLARLSTLGKLLGPPKLISANAAATNGAALQASDQGITIAWAERTNDPAIKPWQVGHSFIQVRHEGHKGGSLSQFDFATTEIHAASMVSLETLDHPRSMLLAYSAMSQGTSSRPRAIFLRQFKCQSLELE